MEGYNGEYNRPCGTDGFEVFHTCCLFCGELSVIHWSSSDSTQRTVLLIRTGCGSFPSATHCRNVRDAMAIFADAALRLISLWLLTVSTCLNLLKVVGRSPRATKSRNVFQLPQVEGTPIREPGMISFVTLNTTPAIPVPRSLYACNLLLSRPRTVRHYETDSNSG